MKKILRKEFALTVIPLNYIFLGFAAMLLIPNYPLYITFFYTAIALNTMFLTGNENNDVLFSALLPIRKCDIVRGRCFTVAILELAEIALCIPFALVRNLLYAESPVEDSVFTEPNVAFFGIAFVLYAALNAILITGFYKTGRGVRFVVPTIAFFVFIVLAESLAFIPATADYIDAVDAASQIKQLPVLVGGMIIYAVGMLLTCHRSEKLFEKIDL